MADFGARKAAGSNAVDAIAHLGNHHRHRNEQSDGSKDQLKDAVGQKETRAGLVGVVISAALVKGLVLFGPASDGYKHPIDVEDGDEAETHGLAGGGLGVAVLNGSPGFVEQDVEGDEADENGDGSKRNQLLYGSVVDAPDEKNQANADAAKVQT